MTKYMGNDSIEHIRIQGSPATNGHAVIVRDVDTNEAIGNISEIIVLLNARDINKAIVTYYKVNEQGAMQAEDGQKPIEVTEELNEPEIDVAALPVPARMLTKVVELWELAQRLARHDTGRSCLFCVGEDGTEGFRHIHSCPIRIASELTREG